MKIQKKQILISAACFLASLFLYGMLTLAQAYSMEQTSVHELQRGTYGSKKKDYELQVEGLSETDAKINISVSPIVYTKEEAMDVYDKIMEELNERIRGDNESLDQVQSDLNLITRIPEYGVRLTWIPEEIKKIDTSGKITAQNIPEEGEDIYLRVRLSDGQFPEEYELRVTLYPPKLTEEESRLAGLRTQIEVMDQLTPWQSAVALPEVFDEQKLTYRFIHNNGFGIIPLLGAVCAVLLYARSNMEEQEKKKKRERELLIDYAEIVSKLKVFVGAGMTVRLAWEKIVSDYQKNMERGIREKRAVYEEMEWVVRQWKSGMPEGQAFREFGNRCALRPYLKLSTLLEQNRRNGDKNLRNMLELEMTDAFEQRKTLARRLGEEAGTKLLIPMFLLLGVVMVIIMLPAMMAM